MLGLDISAEQLLQLLCPGATPWKVCRHDLFNGLLRVNAAGVDGETGAFQRKALFCAREAEIVSHHVHEVGSIIAVVNGEGPIDSDLGRLLTQDARSYPVKGSRPGEAANDGLCAVSDDATRDPFNTTNHFGSCTPRKSHQQDTLRISAVDDEVRDTMGKGVGLARTSASDDEEGRRLGGHSRRDAMLDRMPLSLVEAIEIDNGHDCRIACEATTDHNTILVLFASPPSRIDQHRLNNKALPRVSKC